MEKIFSVIFLFVSILYSKKQYATSIKKIGKTFPKIWNQLYEISRF